MADRIKPVLLRAQVMDENGSVSMQTVRGDSLVADFTIVRSVLTDDLRRRLNAVYEQVGAFVTDWPRERWVETFNVNAHPESETQIWEGIVKAWRSMGGGSRLSPKKNRRVLNALLGISLGVVDVSAISHVSDDFTRRCRTAYAQAVTP